jgi:O-antigen ligase
MAYYLRVYFGFCGFNRGVFCESGIWPDDELHGNVLEPGKRLTGITGTANVAGYISAFTCLALYNYRRYIPNRIPLYFYAMIAINFAVLLLSNSRTSLAALLLSIAVAEMVRLTLSRIIVFFSLICFLILFLMVVDIESILVMATRSGDISEITSGTGRSVIWSLVMRLIEERPFFGWGYASTIFVLPDEGASLGFALPMPIMRFSKFWSRLGLLALFLSLLYS